MSELVVAFIPITCICSNLKTSEVLINIASNLYYYMEILYRSISSRKMMIQ